MEQGGRRDTDGREKRKEGHVWGGELEEGEREEESRYEVPFRVSSCPEFSLGCCLGFPSSPAPAKASSSRIEVLRSYVRLSPLNFPNDFLCFITRSESHWRS